MKTKKQKFIGVITFQLILITSLLLFNINFLFSQKQKLTIDVGVKYRLNPIYLNGYSSLIVIAIDKTIEQDNHLSGFAIPVFVNLKITQNVYFQYFSSLRYDEGEKTLQNAQIINSTKKLFIDNGFFLTKSFNKKNENKIEIGLGYSINNLNSKYKFTYFFGETGTSNFNFQSFNILVNKKFEKIKANLMLEYVFKHKFPSPSKLIMPSLGVLYNIK